MLIYNEYFNIRIIVLKILYFKKGHQIYKKRLIFFKYITIFKSNCKYFHINNKDIITDIL